MRDLIQNVLQYWTWIQFPAPWKILPSLILTPRWPSQKHILYLYRKKEWPLLLWSPPWPGCFRLLCTASRDFFLGYLFNINNIENENIPGGSFYSYCLTRNLLHDHSADHRFIFQINNIFILNFLANYHCRNQEAKKKKELVFSWFSIFGDYNINANQTNSCLLGYLFMITLKSQYE